MRFAWLAACAALFFSGAATAQCPRAVPGERPTLTRESQYSVIFIRRHGPCATLSFRRAGADYLESYSNITDPTELPLPYTRAMTLGFAHAARAESVLAIGVGAGTTIGYTARYLPRARVTAVDIDPVIIELARDYFRLRRFESANLTLAAADGRRFLQRSEARYDIIQLDAFLGGYIPEHLLTLEFFRLARSRLAPGGALVANLHHGTRLFESTVATMRRAFPSVTLYRSGGNVIAIAQEAALSPGALGARAANRQAVYRFRYPLAPLLGARMNYNPPANTRILTDDFSPANQFEAMAPRRSR
ncbi:MAG: spermidine synthase [Hyphomonadaceae bacterium]